MQDNSYNDITLTRLSIHERHYKKHRLVITVILRRKIAEVYVLGLSGGGRSGGGDVVVVVGVKSFYL